MFKEKGSPDFKAAFKEKATLKCFTIFVHYKYVAMGLHLMPLWLNLAASIPQFDAQEGVQLYCTEASNGWWLFTQLQWWKKYPDALL